MVKIHIQIPTTRAISPKLGRHKTSAANSENGSSCLSPKGIVEQSKLQKNSPRNGNKSPACTAAAASSKKPLTRSRSKKGQTRESLLSRSEPKQNKTKSEASEGEDSKNDGQKSEEVSEHDMMMMSQKNKNSAEDSTAASTLAPKPVLEVSVEG